MRVLVSSTGGVGHLIPLLPVARALDRAGHAVRIACPESFTGFAGRYGLPVSGFGEPDPEELAALRAAEGLPADPVGAALLAGVYLTQFPYSVEDPACPADGAWRFREVAPAREPLPDWWAGRDDPLVYVSAGPGLCSARWPPGCRSLSCRCSPTSHATPPGWRRSAPG